MKLYHGTNASSAYSIFTQGIDLSKSMRYLDFGEGFYTTNDKQKAILRARKKTADYNRRNHTKEKPCLVIIDVNRMNLQDLKIRKFESANREWCEFITNNRLDFRFLNEHNIDNHNKDHRYDIVCGEIADGAVAEIAAEIRAGGLKISEVDYTKYFTYTGKTIGYQISFHTANSLKCIENIAYTYLLNVDRTKRKRR